MKVSCILAASQIDKEFSDLILYPEDVDPLEIEKAIRFFPHAIVAGAVTENGKSCGLAFHRGKRCIDYWKVLGDLKRKGSGNCEQNPVYRNDNFCIGLLVCRDIEEVNFSQKVINSVRSSDAQIKIVCIPGDMGSFWFTDETVGHHWTGLNVMLSNNTVTHESRCKSFITDTNRKKIALQINTEEIIADLK